MNKEEYYKRIEKVNNRFKTDRVSADEEYQLVCQKNYLSTKYIEHLEQQCKKQKEAIDKAVKYIDDLRDESAERQGFYNCFPDDLYIPDINELLDILKEVSE